MIYINELRRKLRSDDLIDHIGIHANVKPTITELLDRLEAAERNLNCCHGERMEAASLFLSVKTRLTEERDALRAALRHEADCVEACKAEVETLLARIEAMENQEPIGEMLEVSPHNYELRWYRSVPFGAKLYTLPGAKAQPAPSVPDAWGKDLFSIKHAMAMNNWNWNSEASDNLKREACAAITRLLAAAPEAKP